MWESHTSRKFEWRHNCGISEIYRAAMIMVHWDVRFKVFLYNVRGNSPLLNFRLYQLKPPKLVWYIEFLLQNFSGDTSKCLTSYLSLVSHLGTEDIVVLSVSVTHFCNAFFVLFCFSKSGHSRRVFTSSISSLHTTIFSSFHLTFLSNLYKYFLHCSITNFSTINQTYYTQTTVQFCNDTQLSPSYVLSIHSVFFAWEL